jgi:monoamine oxidase
MLVLETRDRLGGRTLTVQGAPCESAALGQPIAGTLFSAGEATDFQGFSGTVHGTLESGYRVAREILCT